MKVFAFLFFMLLSLCSFGQNRIPQKGERIMFYPLNENNEIAKLGYDCFYTTNQVIDKEKYNFKTKFRFKKNELGVTPSKEIEGYTFYVQNKKVISSNGHDVMLLFLNREVDSLQVLLRIPKYYDKKSNKLTQCFIKKQYNIKSDEFTYYIILPFVNVDTLSVLRKRYINKDIVYDYNSLHYKRIDHLEMLFKKLNDNYNKLHFNVTYKCHDFVYRPISGYMYKQLCVALTTPTGTLQYMPVTYFIGSLNEYDRNGSVQFNFLNSFFWDRNEYLQKEFKKEKCEDVVKKFTGKRVYYGLHEHYLYEKDNDRSSNVDENCILRTGDIYKIKEGAYECVRFDVLKRNAKGYNNSWIPFAILKDDNGVEFRVPVTKTYMSSYNKSYCDSFEEYFVLNQLVDSIVQNRKDLALQKELAEKEKKRTLVNKYGVTYANFLMNIRYEIRDELIEKFEALSRKYGKASAKLIMEGVVRLGWSREMCRESWGKPDKVNTTRGSWGVHEQWVYEYSFTDSYSIKCLYFENGVLVTIQD